MGFKLRSGNGVPFKEMGSSPAKNLGSIMSAFGGGAKQADIMNQKAAKVNKSINDKAITIDESKNVDVNPEAKIKIKDTGKTTSLSSRPDGKDPVTKTASPKENKPTTKKKGNWFTRAAEKSHKFRNSEEGARFQDQMNKVANIADRKGNYSTDNLEKFRTNKRAQEIHDVKMSNVERNQLETDTQNQLRKLRIENLQKNNEVPETKKSAVDDSGNPALDPNAVRSGERYKNE